MGNRGLEGGSPKRGGPEPLLYDPGRLLYLCRSDCAQNGGGLTAGREEIGDPRDGKELWPRPQRRFTALPGGSGRAPGLGPCFRKSCLTPLHWAEERKQLLRQGRGCPFPIGAGLGRAAPGLTGGSGGEGASRREEPPRRARRRGSGARAEPISQRHCMRSVEEKNVLVFGAGEGGAR